MISNKICKNNVSIASIWRRNLVDLIKLDEKLKIQKGQYMGDCALERGCYDSAVPKAQSAGVTVAEYKQRRRKWVPVVKGQIVYGTYPVLEALKADRRQIFKLFCKPNLLLDKEGKVKKNEIEEIISLAASKGIRTQELQLRQLDILCNYQVHNGICIDAMPLLFKKLDEDKLLSLGSLLFLDNVLDTFNIGAIARSCLFFGIMDIVLPYNKGPKAITPAMSRASTGAIEYLSMHKVFNTESFLKKAKELDYIIIGTSDEFSATERTMKSVVSLENLKPFSKGEKFIVILGNEHNGISEVASGLCNYIVSIPKLNNKCDSKQNSLNVSATTAILLYHLQK